MKIVHLSFSYGSANVGGATIAASRLHRALCTHGVDSIFLCTYNFGLHDSPVIEFPPRKGIRRRAFIWLTRLMRWVVSWLGCHGKVPAHLINSGVLHEINRLNPDVVHIHRIAPDAVSFAELSKIKQPIVVTLHDFSLINGVEPYPTQEKRRCLFNQWMIKREKRLWDCVHPTFVTPSRWAKSICQQSSIGGGHQVEYIPYIQDPIFAFHSEWRTKSSKVRLLFGSYAGRKPKIKGYDSLLCALNEMSEEEQKLFELRIFGEEGPDEKIGQVDVKLLGAIKSPAEMVRVYHDADIFILPSLQETQGQVKLEAMLCGLPVIAFGRSACAEGIVEGVSGSIVPDASILGLKDAIVSWGKRVISDALNRPEIARIIMTQLHEEMLVDRYKALYSKLLVHYAS